jgi:hypothetical protein
MKLTRKISLATTTFLVLFMTSLAFGMPQTINHQGFVANSSGGGYSGSKNFTFKLYDVDTGGSALWQEVIPVTVVNGTYSVILGDDPGNLLDPAIFSDQLYLGIQLDGEAAEMGPRQQLSSTPYSIRAATVEEGGLLFVKDNGTTIGRLITMADNGSDESYTIFTSEGYKARLSPVDATGGSYGYKVDGLGNTLVYGAADCAGTPYVEKLLNPGMVICDASNNCYYTDKTAIHTQITPLSYFDGSCTNSPLPSGWRLPLVANDEVVTGIVANGVYSGPITVSAR